MPDHRPRRSSRSSIIQLPASKLALFNLDDACRGRARAELDDLLAFPRDGRGKTSARSSRSFAWSWRPTYRSNFPGAFLPEDNLGGILQKIRAGGDQHPANSHYETLERINDYTATTTMARTRVVRWSRVLDQTELMGYVNTTPQNRQRTPGLA